MVHFSPPNIAANSSCVRHFATESGKSKGQFYTPAEVSRVIAKVVGINSETRQDQTLYDPTCGSGSLLLKAADESPRGIIIYGQETDNSTRGLARMNREVTNTVTGFVTARMMSAFQNWRHHKFL